MRVPWGKKQKVATATIAIGAILLCAVLWMVSSPSVEPEAPVDPTDACVGFTNAKLDQRFAGNPAGMNGSSWETAYVFEDLIVMKHGWTFSYTTRYVIIRNCAFRHLVDHGLEFDRAQHVRVSGSSFLNGTTAISLEDASDITIANSSFEANGKALRLDGGANCHIINNSFTGNTLAIKGMPFTSGVIFTLNHFAGNAVIAEEASSCYNSWFQGTIGNYYADYFTIFPWATLNGSDPALAGLCDPAAGQVFVGSAWYPVSNRSVDRYPLVLVPSAPPAIEVNTPLSGTVVGNTSAPYEVSIAGQYVVAAWYNIGTDPANYSLGVSLPIKGSAMATGTINQTAWATQVDGDVTIAFNARSITGAPGSAGVTVIRDTTPPALEITSPTNASAHHLPPSFILDIVELHLATITCHVAGQSFPVSASGSVPAEGWNAAPQGVVSLGFTVMDGAGNLVSKMITIFKDSEGPSITFAGIAQHAAVGSTPPVITVNSMDDFAGVASDAYYRIGGNPLQHALTLSEGIGGNKTVTFAVNASAWWALPEGSVSILVTCADTLGNTATETLWLELDLSAPVIQVLAPLGDFAVGETPGYFALLVNDSHLGAIWWSLDGGATKFPVTYWTGAGWAGYFAASEWAEHFVPSGNMVITFFASDTLGNVARADVTVQCVAVSSGPDPLGDFLEEPSNLLLFGIMCLLGVLVYAHFHQTKKLGAKLR